MKQIIFIYFLIFWISCIIFGFLHNKPMMMMCAFMMGGAVVTEYRACLPRVLGPKECYFKLYGGGK